MMLKRVRSNSRVRRIQKNDILEKVIDRLSVQKSQEENIQNLYLRAVKSRPVRKMVTSVRPMTTFKSSRSPKSVYTNVHPQPQNQLKKNTRGKSWFDLSRQNSSYSRFRRSDAFQITNARTKDFGATKTEGDGRGWTSRSSSAFSVKLDPKLVQKAIDKVTPSPTFIETLQTTSNWSMKESLTKVLCDALVIGSITPKAKVRSFQVTGVQSRQLSRPKSVSNNRRYKL